MTDRDLYETLYRAFTIAGRQMGEDLKGLSCLRRNWGKLAAEMEGEQKKAA